MGYGEKLKEHIDNTPGMTVNKLASMTNIAASTLYSIIKRDSPIRYDFAIRIANTLGINVSELCKDNPFEDDNSPLPDAPKSLDAIFPNGMTRLLIEYQLSPILRILGSDEAANVEQLLTSYAKLTDQGRSAVFDNINTLLKVATDPAREKEVTEKIKTFKKDKKNRF